MMMAVMMVVMVVVVMVMMTTVVVVVVAAVGGNGAGGGGGGSDGGHGSGVVVVIIVGVVVVVGGGGGDLGQRTRAHLERFLCDGRRRPEQRLLLRVSRAQLVALEIERLARKVRSQRAFLADLGAERRLPVVSAAWVGVAASVARAVTPSLGQPRRPPNAAMSSYLRGLQAHPRLLTTVPTPRRPVRPPSFLVLP